MTRINLNERIKVRLTDLGKDIYYHQFDDLNEMAGRCVCKPEYPKTDEDGYTEFQLWVFIELYGKHIGMAKPNVIYPNEMVCVGEPTIEAEPIKHGRWIWYSEICAYSCSECHKYQYGNTLDVLNGTYRYCPNCGARMDGGEE